MIKIDASFMTRKSNLVDLLAKAKAHFPTTSVRLDCQFGGPSDYQGVVLAKDVSGEKASENLGKAIYCANIAKTLANEGWSGNRWHVWAPPGTDTGAVGSMIAAILECDPKAEFELFRQPDVHAVNSDGYIDLRWFEYTHNFMSEIDVSDAVFCGHMCNLSGKVAKSWRYANGESSIFKNDHAKAISDRISFVAIDVYPSPLRSYIATEGQYIKRFQHEVFNRFREASYDIARSVQLGEFNAVLPSGDARLEWYRSALIQYVNETEFTGVMHTLHEPNSPLSIMDERGNVYLEAQ